jgi:hypothetical protein
MIPKTAQRDGIEEEKERKGQSYFDHHHSDRIGIGARISHVHGHTLLQAFLINSEIWTPFKHLFLFCSWCVLECRAWLLLFSSFCGKVLTLIVAFKACCCLSALAELSGVGESLCCCWFCYSIWFSLTQKQNIHTYPPHRIRRHCSHFPTSPIWLFASFLSWQNLLSWFPWNLCVVVSYVAR